MRLGTCKSAFVSGHGDIPRKSPFFCRFVISRNVCAKARVIGRMSALNKKTSSKKILAPRKATPMRVLSGNIKPDRSDPARQAIAVEKHEIMLHLLLKNRILYFLAIK